MMPSAIDPSWADALGPVFASPGMAALRDYLKAEKAAGKRILPHSADWFTALSLTPLDKVRVVILGQDPYHGPGQAHGLSFSVRPGVAVPPSLRNIYKELHSDLGVVPPAHGFLEHWARQGVLLLNAVLTVEQGRAAAHAGRGWEALTDAVVDVGTQHLERDRPREPAIDRAVDDAHRAGRDALDHPVAPEVRSEQRLDGRERRRQGARHRSCGR